MSKQTGSIAQWLAKACVSLTILLVVADMALGAPRLDPIERFGSAADSNSDDELLVDGYLAARREDTSGDELFDASNRGESQEERVDSDAMYQRAFKQMFKRMAAAPPSHNLNSLKNKLNNIKEGCHLGLGMGFNCHANSITKYAQYLKLLSHPKMPGRR